MERKEESILDFLEGTDASVVIEAGRNHQYKDVSAEEMSEDEKKARAERQKGIMKGSICRENRR